MIPDQVKSAISKALFLLPPPMTSPEARAMLYAIGLQESRFQFRRQMIKKGGVLVPEGPAKSFWQGELTGGMCSGVRNHPTSKFWAHHLCQARRCEFTARAMWNAIETDDVLAAGLARLLLFTDHRKLPAVGDEKGAWNLYIRTWRPGKPHPATWPALYAEAMEAL